MKLMKKIDTLIRKMGGIANMEEFLRNILFGINLFYPLLFLSFGIFVYSLFKRSWLFVLASFFIILPNVLYLTYFPFPLNLSVIYVVIQLVLIISFYLNSKKGKGMAIN